MASATNSGIKTSGDGASYIPASKRADGSVRKEIRVRRGYKPPEDVETYKNRSAEAWKNRGGGGVPGAQSPVTVSENKDAKSKNAKRREAARMRAEADGQDTNQLATALANTSVQAEEHLGREGSDPTMLENGASDRVDEDAERQKKLRNLLKKLKAVQELRSKKAAGDKLSPDQLIKISTKADVIRDLKKLGYDGHELPGTAADDTS